MNDLSPVYDLLRSDGSIVINKNLCHAIGINESIIYAELLSRYNYFNTREQLDENGFFFNTVNDLKEATCVGEKSQKKCINNLIKLKLIEYKLKNVPPKRYFKIVDDTSILLDLVKIGADKMKEMHANNLESVAISKLRLLGGIETSNMTELKPPKGRVNNTKVNKPKVNKTKEPILFLTEVECESYGSREFLNYYLQAIFNNRGKKHGRVSETNSKTVCSNLKSLEDEGITPEQWKEGVDTHFKTLPANNNGSIIPFLKASMRYFGVDLR